MCCPPASTIEGSRQVGREPLIFRQATSLYSNDFAANSHCIAQRRLADFLHISITESMIERCPTYANYEKVKPLISPESSMARGPSPSREPTAAKTEDRS